MKKISEKILMMFQKTCSRLHLGKTLSIRLSEKVQILKKNASCSKNRTDRTECSAMTLPVQIPKRRRLTHGRSVCISNRSSGTLQTVSGIFPADAILSEYSPTTPQATVIKDSTLSSPTAIRLATETLPRAAAVKHSWPPSALPLLLPISFRAGTEESSLILFSSMKDSVHWMKTPSTALFLS